jgi:hypothetical protein
MEIFVNDIVKLTADDSVKLGKVAEIDRDLLRISDAWYDLNVYSAEVLFSESSGIGNPLVDTA